MDIQDSFSLFILPFTFDASNFEGLPEKSIWERSHINIAENCFFDHIKDYLSANLKGEKIDKESVVIYDLKDTFKGTSLDTKSAVSSLLKKTHRIQVDGQQIDFKFIIQKRKLTSPKLLLFPLTSVGMILFSIELTTEKSMEKLMDLNYCLEKYETNQSRIIEIVQLSDKKEELTQINNIYEALKQPERTEKFSESYWTFSQLVALLTTDLKTLNIKLTNSSRFHIYSYCQIDSKNENQNKVELDFGRLIRCQNMNYNPLMIDISGNELVKQTFDNIYIGTCVEGAGIMVDTFASKSLFLNQFKDQAVTERYLWVYLLVYHQRLALCHMITQLSKTEININTKKEALLNLISCYSKIMLKTKFTDISDFTQHNTYYQFCMKNLAVNSYYKELDEKLKAIDNVVDEKNDKEQIEKTKRLENWAKSLLVPQVIFALIALYLSFHSIQFNQPFGSDFWQITIIIIASILLFLLALPAIIFGCTIFKELMRVNDKNKK